MRALALVVLCGCDIIARLDGVTPTTGTIDMPGTWAEIVAAKDHNCGLRVDGTLWCWGKNDHGQLGLPMTDLSSAMPTQIGSATWLAVSARTSTTCGLQSDGSVWCWGVDDHGQVGDGGTADRFEPVLVMAGAWTTVTAGLSHTCALAADGTAWCWGDNSHGQLGVGDMTARTTPTQVPGTWTSLVAGAAHTCAIASDASGWCWGLNTDGELGDGTALDQLAPVQIDGELWAQLAPGETHTCGLRTDHKLRCWGTNYSGELGTPSTSSSESPTIVDIDESDWDQVATGGSSSYTIVLPPPGIVGGGGGGGSAMGSAHTCATKHDGSLWCWGSNASGQLGNSSFDDHIAHPLEVTGGARQWTQVAAGTDHTCGIGDEDHLWCFGIAAGAASLTTPTQVPGTWTTASAGSLSTCAIDSSSALACWGGNGGGQLGDGSYVQRSAPTTIAGPGWSAVSVGYSWACAVATDGTLACWGSNYAGLGQGAMNRLTPTTIPGSWRAIAIGHGSSGHACAIDATSHLWCWGSNFAGQLGNGTLIDQSTPQQIGTLTWSAVSAGYEHTCGISASGTKCWGYNGDFELASTMPVQSETPLSVSVSATTIALGDWHTCAIGGTMASCWGYDFYSELGDGLMASRSTPFTVTGQWVDIAGGSYTTCGIRADHTLWCWGDNSYGQVGIGSTTPAEVMTPTKIGMDTTWQHVTVGGSHACATKMDSSLWCWGDDSYGQLGLGTVVGGPVLVP